MRKLQILPLLVLALALAGTETNAQTSGKRPVIIIPGISGSNLVNAKTGKTVWFSIRRDKDDDLRLPMTSPILARNRDGLQATDIIREIKLPVLPDVQVYQTLIDALKARGYAEADWKNPRASDVFYVFPYDWRRDNVESAHLLMRKMIAVKGALKRGDIKFDIISHSMGGLIARYAAMYGLADLARDGVAPVPSWAGAAHINKLLMFGTPNEGSFGSLEALLNGYAIISDRKLPLIDDLRAEDVLTSPSVFQLIPHGSSARFLDEDLRPIRVNIYDPETWMKYRWGPLSDPKFLSKLRDARQLAVRNKEIKPATLKKDAGADDRLLARTTFAQARSFFSAVLNRAKRFHAALDAPVTNAPLQLFAYGGNCEQTLNAVVLVRDAKDDRWHTLFTARDIKRSAGAEIKKDVVKAAMFALGDGQVTKDSLLSANIPVTSSFFICTSHTKLFLEKPIQDSFLSALVVETQKQP